MGPRYAHFQSLVLLYPVVKCILILDANCFWRFSIL
jgi:hypothetical protein